jgi:branched-chain amino acid transport system substrate-binding protein
MKHRKLLTMIAVVGSFALVASACSNDDSGGGDGSASATAATDCNTDQFGCVTVASGEPIKLGSLLSISGDTKALGDDSNAGIELALDYLDGNFDQIQGQIAGHDVDLVKEDDLCSADGGQQGGTKLAADAKIFAVVGTTCSSSALGVADTIMSDVGTVLISPSNTNPSLTESGTHQPFYMRTAYNDRIQAAVVNNWAQKQGFKTAATIHDESPYATALTEVFGSNFEQSGGTITAAESIQSTDTDFKSLLATIGKDKPDLLYFPDFDPACGLIATQAAQTAGLENTVLAGSDGCLTSTFIEEGGKAVDGVFASGPDLSAFAQQAFYEDQFLPAYEELVGTAPTSAYHAQAYDATNMIAQAIESVAVTGDDGSLTISRTAFQEAMFATSGYEGITGTITCNSDGDCAGATTVGMYVAPAFPCCDDNAKPTYSETLSLADVAAA